MPELLPVATLPVKEYEYILPHKSQLIYQFPLNSTETPSRILRGIGLTKKINNFLVELGSPAHQGPHSGAIDFIVPENTSILAAAEGEVVAVVDQYEIPKCLRIIGAPYWLTKAFMKKKNFVLIKHQQGKIIEYSYYVHLGKNQAQVAVGDKVMAGQVIGFTGWSGLMDRPHLHFMVFTPNPVQFPQEKFESLEPQWQNQS